jgi:hypothetical protein
MKSNALPRWMYSDPQNIADGLIAQSRRQEEAQVKQFEMQLKQNRRRIKALVKGVKWNGGSR